MASAGCVDQSGSNHAQ